MIFFYNLLTSLAALLIVPAFTLYSLATGKKRRGLWNHFGWVPVANKSGFEKTVWVHALSRGEVVAAAPVLKRLGELRPNVQIVVSVTTDSGYDAAKELLDGAGSVHFHPFDCWAFNRLALGRIQPDAFVLAETGFWPGLLAGLNGRGIPAILFNGRLSIKTFSRYKKLRPIIRRILNRFSLLCMQSEQGMRDFQELGADADSLLLTGETKYDALQTVTEDESNRLRGELGLAADALVFVAGSTHAGEEEIILEAFEKMRRDLPKLILILAPRRVERIPDLERLLESRSIAFVKRTDSKSGSGSVILLDTMGELFKIYSLAHAVFVGASLVAPGGGHNLLEPASLGKATFHGPYLEYKQGDADDLARAGLAVQATDAEELAREAGRVLADATHRAALSEKARTFVQARRGASQLVAEKIIQLLDAKSIP